MTLAEATRIRIKELIVSNKMNINMLATKSGINESTLRSILNASTEHPKNITIYYICLGLGITLSQFYDSELFSQDNINDD